MRRIDLFIIASVILFLTGCGSTRHITKEQLADKWVLKTINNIPATQVYKDRLPQMVFNFDIEQISGNAGCNVFSGKFIYENGVFQASNIVKTLMACLNGNDETAFLQLLDKQSKVSLINGDLLFAQNGQPVLIFSRAKPLGAADLVGVWKLLSIEGKSIDENNQVPSFEFDFVGNKISGSTGCNRFNTPFTLSKNVLNIEPMVTTRMACDNMENENRFVNNFTGKFNIDIDENSLTLRRDNKMIMTFTR